MKEILKFSINTIIPISLLIIAGFVGYKEILVPDSEKFQVNTIGTWFRNNGSFNRNPTTGNAGFEWAFNTNRYARYASGLWIGAKVNNDTLVTVAEYEYEYGPGYTDKSGDPQGGSDPMYRIYTITKGINGKDRMNWPNSLLGNSDQGAPVIFDSLFGILKAADFGDKTMFYVYTDSYPALHGSDPGSTAPLKADIKQLNFGLNTAGEPLKHVIFTQFIVINRSQNIWHDTFFNLWTDDDIGESADDRIGCDSALKMGYTYNGDNMDAVYGSAPPAVAFILLKGALKFTGNSSDVASFCLNSNRQNKTGFRDAGMTAFNADGISDSYRESYRLMKGQTSTGNVVMHPQGYTTTLYYSGDPTSGSGWIQESSGDQSFLLSSGPVDVAPGDTQVVTIAQIIARGSNNIHSITLLRQYASDVKEFYMDCYNFDPVSVNEITTVKNDFRLYQNYPNPFNPVTKIKIEVSSQNRTSKNVKLVVFDISGKEVLTLADEKYSPGIYEFEFDGKDLSGGIYFYTLIAGSYKETKRMILLK